MLVPDQGDEDALTRLAGLLLDLGALGMPKRDSNKKKLKSGKYLIHLLESKHILEFTYGK